MQDPFYYHYILDEQGNPQPEPDLMKWAVWHEEANRQVAETYFGDIRVSTVFLSLPHVSNTSTDDTVPMLYETMIFTDETILAQLLELSEVDDRSIICKLFGGIDIQKRYATKSEALDGHKQMCLFIETCVAKGLIAVNTNKEDQPTE